MSPSASVSPNPETTEEEDEGPTTEDRKPKKIADPRRPRKEEVEAHELTHVPYRSWCEVCVRGRGKSRPHTAGRQERGLPELHFDYMFVGPEDQPGKCKTCLVIREVETRMSLAIMVPTKGRDAYVADRAVAFLEELGCLSGDVVTKSDQEPSMKALVNQVGMLRASKGTGRWIIEHSPVGESQANGVVERGVQSIEGQLRVIKLALETRWGAEIPVEHPILAWAVEYASFLLNRYEVGHDGKTAYERLKRKRAVTMGYEFGEKVLWKISGTDGALGKLSSTWRTGVYVGVRGRSGEIVVQDSTGTWRTRTVRRRPLEERWDAKYADEVVKVPWVKADGKEDIAEEKVGLRMNDEEFENEAAKEVPEIVPRNFYIKAKDFEEHGYTSGCPGCASLIRGGARRGHAKECRKRMEDILKDSDRFKATSTRIDNYLADRLEKADEERKKQRTETEEAGGEKKEDLQEDEPKEKRARAQGPKENDVEMHEVPQPSSSGSSGSGLTADERKRAAAAEPSAAPPAKKLGPREALQRWDTIGDSEMEATLQAVILEDTASDDESEDEDESFEELGGEQAEQANREDLDPEQVAEAHEDEIKELESRVYGEVDIKEAWQVTGKRPIPVRWVDGRKKDGRHRSRLVAKDYKTRNSRNKIEDLFASMPPLELVKLVLARAAEVGDKAMFIDVKKAHLHAPIAGNVYVDLPPERARPGKCAKLKFTLYGMRRAARNWEAEYSKTLTEVGFESGKANGSSFFHRERDIRIVVHGDDFVITGREDQLRWVESVIKAKYPIVNKGIFGPGPDDLKSVTVLNRKVVWTRDGVEFEADKVHVEKMLKTTRMEGCNPVLVPGAADETKESDVPIEGGQCAAYRSAVARANYLAHDRPDIRYTVRSLCQKMAEPSVQDWARLKKLCRYLKGRPRLVQRKIRTRPGVIEVYADSDWAGCRATRKSTSGGAMFAFGMCLKNWAVTQTTTARSSGEAELYAVNKGMAEALGLQSMCKELGIDLEVVVHTDSDACRGTCSRVGLGNMKHLEVEELWSQEVVRKGRARLERVPGKENPADLMTKFQDKSTIDYLLMAMGFSEE